MNVELIVRGQAVVLGAEVVPASIHIAGGVIQSVEGYETLARGAEVIDAGSLVVMPGVVDTHVHINDPGRAHWEGFLTGTRAAAAGGVTTLVDMPLNSIPATTSMEGLRAKLAAAEGTCSVDVGFWGGVVPGNTEEIEPLLDAGVLGFKCFLVPSGVDEFPAVDEGHLRKALPAIARNRSVLLAHAEAPGPIERARPPRSPRSYSTYLTSRPQEAETEAIELLIRLSREYDARTHIVHLSAGRALGALRKARQEGLPVTVETCPHYLCFSAEEIADGATEFKCAPPIREHSNRELLWAALEQGDIDLVATDHSPCPPEMKGAAEGDFFRAWGGIASLQFGLPALWTEARRRGIGLARVSEWLSSAPARLAGLAGRKGSITPGADADLIFFDPEEPVDWSKPVEHRHKMTPYRGRALTGVVERTLVRGRTVFLRGEFPEHPLGAILRSGLHELNHATVERARASFDQCCGSKRWAGEMAAMRPFANLNQLLSAGERAAAGLATQDWLEAFAAHPRIGSRGGSNWSKQEQRGVSTAGDDVREELARLNAEYFHRFGFIFIVCATGKNASEMLGDLRERIANSRERELAIAAGEQRKITALRLRRLLGE